MVSTLTDTATPSASQSIYRHALHRTKDAGRSPQGCHNQLSVRASSVQLLGGHQ